MIRFKRTPVTGEELIGSVIQGTYKGPAGRIWYYRVESVSAGIGRRRTDTGDLIGITIGGLVEATLHNSVSHVSLKPGCNVKMRRQPTGYEIIAVKVKNTWVPSEIQDPSPSTYTGSFLDEFFQPQMQS